MSTPTIASPARPPALDGTHPSPRERAARLIRGRTADPAWSRPALLAITVLASLLTVWGLTRNGYANTYYAEAVQAGSHSWKALFTNAEDLSGFVSLDKGPLSLWMMGLSGRIFGFTSLSMLLPNAACGVASVLVLHNLVNRTLGHRAAVLAALLLALSPVAVAVSRFNNPDALLLLCVICAAWALVRALESGRTRHLVLSGTLVGLAFNTKMLEAYLVVPGLALSYLLAGRGSVPRRLIQLLAAGAAMAFVSFSWFTTMMLIPATHRPWVGDTNHNSWFELIFGANGLSRVSGNTGGPGGGGFGGSSGPLRLFNSAVGAQIAWLLPLAAGGLLAGLCLRRRAPRQDARRAAYLLWGAWALVSFAIFSFSNGIFHPYYTSLLAPALAVLCAGGAVSLWDARRSTWAAILLSAAILATAALSFTLLARTPTFLPALRWLILAAALLFAAAILAMRLTAPLLNGRRLGVVAALGLLAVLAGPGAYAIATVGHSTTGSNPLGGPASVSRGGFAFGGGRRLGGSGLPGGGGRSRGRGFPGAANRRPSEFPGSQNGEQPQGPGASNGSAGLPSAGSPPLFGNRSPAGGSGAPGANGGPSGGVASALAGRIPGAGGVPGAASGLPGTAGGILGAGGAGGVSKQLLTYLKAHRGRAKYIIAAVGSQAAGAIELATNQPVVTIGGFMGGDPAPTTTQLAALVRSGQLRYLLLDSSGGMGVGGGGGGRAFGGGGTRSGSSTLTQWVKSHGTAITYSTTGNSTGAGQTLYELDKVT